MIDCVKRAISDQIHIHADRQRPGPWSLDDLRPQMPRPHEPAGLNLPLVPFSALGLPTSIPRYMISCPPVSATRKRTTPISTETDQFLPSVSARSAPSRVVRSHITSSSGSSIQEAAHPILPNRDPDDFWPMNGEANCQTGLYPLTSSIFPPITPVGYTAIEGHWRRVQRQGKYVRGPAITVSKKTILPRRPLLSSGTNVWAGYRREALEREKREKYARIRAMEEEPANAEEPSRNAWIKPYLDPVADPKGKRKAEDDLPPEAPQKKYSVERITRASANRATRLTGRSVGIARFEEMIPFERQGIKLGYLPPDFDLSK